MHLLQVVRHTVTVWSSHVTQEIREILELKYRIGKPFQISKLYILCRHQFWGFGEIFDSVACSSSGKLPDRSQIEFRSETASRMADLVERGAPYYFYREGFGCNFRRLRGGVPIILM